MEIFHTRLDKKLIKQKHAAYIFIETFILMRLKAEAEYHNDLRFRKKCNTPHCII